MIIENDGDELIDEVCQPGTQDIQTEISDNKIEGKTKI